MFYDLFEVGVGFGFGGKTAGRVFVHAVMLIIIDISQVFINRRRVVDRAVFGGELHLVDNADVFVDSWFFGLFRCLRHFLLKLNGIFLIVGLVGAEGAVYCRREDILAVFRHHISLLGGI